MQYRYTDEPIEIIESRSESEPAKLTGYGAVFYNGLPQTEYVLWDDHRGRAVERIKPEAFDEAIATRTIDLRYDHKSDWTIDNTDITLKLRKDNKGIQIESTIDPADPQYQTVAAKVKKRLAKGMSFGFKEGQRSKTIDQWTREGKTNVRWLNKIDCFEFSVVRDPAYTATTSNIRSAEEIKDAEISYLKYQTQIREENLKRFA